MKKKIQRFWPIALLIILTIFLRLIKLQDLFYFTYDEAVPAFVGRRIVLWHHIPLIGGVTPFGFHLGPYFYWFYSILLFIGKLNPIIWGLGAAILASLTTFFIYRVGKEFGNKKLAFTAATFWTFSYLANVYDRHLWALYWGPITGLLTIFSLNKIVNGQKRFTYLLCLTLAISIHADPSNLVFVLVAALTFIFFKLPYKKALLIFIAFFIISITPLVIFDFRHNFANTTPILNFIGTGNNNPAFNFEKLSHNSLLFPRTFSRLIYTFGDNEISKQYSYCRYYIFEKFAKIPLLVLILSSLFLTSFVFWAFVLNKKAGWKIIALTMAVYFLGIQIYGTVFQADIFEHYLTGLLPLFLLSFAKLISSFPKKILMLVLIFFTATNLNKLFNTQNMMSLTAKKNAIVYTLEQVGDRPFSLDSLSTCWKYNGYRYLFAVFGKEPVKSYVDPNFAYLYGTTPVWEKHPDSVVTFVIHDYQPETVDFYKRYNLLKLHQTKNAFFGNIEVVILDNSSGWFDQSKTQKSQKEPFNIE